MSKEQEKIPDELEGKVLVAFPGKEKEFVERFNQMATIAQGALGWDGHAQLMFELKDNISGLENCTKEEIKSYIIQSHLQSLYEVSEWITEEEAEKRRQATETLYGEPKAEVPTGG